MTTSWGRAGVLGVALALAATACGSSGSGTTAATSVATSPGGDTATTAATSGEPAYAVALEPDLQALLSTLLVPGAGVVVRSEEQGDWTATFGTQAIGSSEPVTIGDHVRIGSNTKTMTGTVILQLVQEGRLALDTPISTFRPEVPNGANITIAQLLAMRSGLYNYTRSPILNQTLDANPQKVWAPAELLAIAFAQPPDFAPGTKYEYSNTNTVLLGLVIEQLTRKPVEQVFAERIFTPLGLQDTSFPARTDNALPAPFARGYMYGTNLETIDSQVLPADQQAAAAAGTLKPTDTTNDNPSWGWTAGAGISTADDLVRYVQALVGGGLLDDQHQQDRLASIQPTDPTKPDGTGYGYALARLGPMYGHTGELPGYNSFMGYDPVRKVTIITWTSLSAAPDGTAPATAMARLIIGQLYGDASRAQAPSASN